MINKSVICVLHIGLHHTGTTSFQNFLQKNRRILINHSIFYPETGIYGNQHSLIPGSFLPEHRALPNNRSLEIDFYLNNLHKEIQFHDCEMCILSSEVFTELAQKNIKNIEEIIKKLEKTFTQIYIFITTREVKERALSQVKAKLRLSQTNKSFRNEIFNVENYFDTKLKAPEIILKKWKSVSDNIIVQKADPLKNNIKESFINIFSIFKEENKRRLEEFLTRKDLDFNINSNFDPYPQAIYLILLLVATSIFNKDEYIENNLNILVILNHFSNISQKHKEVLMEIKKKDLLNFIYFKKELSQNNSNNVDIDLLLNRLNFRYSVSYFLKKSINEVLKDLIEDKI